MIGQDQGDHGLGHGHNPGRDGRVVPSFDLDLCGLASDKIDSSLPLGDGRRRLHGNSADDGCARGDAAQDAAGVVALRNRSCLLE